MNLRKRFFLLSLLICLPFWAFALWVVGYSYHRIHYQTGAYNPQLFLIRPDRDDYHFVINDTLHYVWKQLTATGKIPNEKSLPSYNLAIAHGDYDKLTRTDKSMRSEYVRTTMTFGNKTYPVRTRNRGGHFWHFFYPKKSWRVKLMGGAEIGGFEEFDLVAPKTYPPIDPLIDRWADRVGVQTFGSQFAALSVNGNYNGIVYLTPTLSKKFLHQTGLGPGAVYGIDPEIREALPHRQNISAGWEDGHKWLLLYQSQPDTDRTPLVDLIRDLKLPPREFDRKYHGKGILDGYVRQLALLSYIGIFHQYATANQKLHYSPEREMFTPILWDSLWPMVFETFFYSGHPIFNKLLTSPYFVADLVRQMDKIRGALPWERLASDMGEYFDKVRSLFLDDRNALAIYSMTEFYDLNIFFVMRGLDDTKMRYLEMAMKYIVGKNVARVNRDLASHNLRYALSRRADRIAISLSCQSWRPCYLHKIRLDGQELKASPLADRNCDGRPDKGRTVTTKLDLLPALKEFRNLYDAKYPVFPSRESINFYLGTMVYPLLLPVDRVPKHLEFLVSHGDGQEAKWISGESVADMANNHSSFHPWGPACD